MKRINRQGWR